MANSVLLSEHVKNASENYQMGLTTFKEYRLHVERAFQEFDREVEDEIRELHREKSLRVAGINTRIKELEQFQR